MPPKKQTKPTSKKNPASTRNQNPPSPMTLRSARMEEPTHSEHSHSSHRNRTPTPTSKHQQDTPKRNTPKGRIISNEPSLSPSCSKSQKGSSKKGSTRKSGGKSTKKSGQITQTMTVQQVIMAEQAKKAKEAIKAPPKKDQSKRIPAKTSQTKMEEEPVVTSNKKRSKMVIDDVDTPLNRPIPKGQELPRNSSAHKNSPLHPSSASRQHVSQGSEEDDFGMAARLRDLTFEHFQGLHLDAEQKVVFEVMFREGSSEKKRQVDFTSRELAFLEKWLGKKFRFDFLEEYLTAQAKQ